MTDVTVTLTLDDIKLYDRARAIGLPSIVISMYGDRIKKLLAEERESERKACWNIIFEYAGRDDITLEDESLLKHLADLIRARGQA